MSYTFTTILAIREATWRCGQTSLARKSLIWLTGEYTGGGDSRSAGRDHLNSIDAEMSCPRSTRRNECTYKRRQPLGRRRMNSEQNDPGLFQWTLTLNSDLSKVLVKR
jgi:hypothetical protein